MTGEKPWRDKSFLYDQYWREEKSPYDIAEDGDCSYRTIYDWMDRLGVPRRTQRESALARWRKNSVPQFETYENGYERWVTWYDSERYLVMVHRLLAVAEYGFEAVKGKHVHHDNGVPWDNRPENIELLTASEHSKLHFEERDDIGPEIGLVAQYGAEAVLGPNEQYGSKKAAAEAKGAQND